MESSSSYVYKNGEKNNVTPFERANYMKLSWIIAATLFITSCASIQKNQRTRNQAVAIGVLTVVVIGGAVLWFGTERCDEMTGYCTGDEEMPQSGAHWQ